MKSSTKANIRKISTSDFFLNNLRKSLQKFNVDVQVSKLRQLIHFGPWRNIFKSIIRTVNPPQFEYHDTTLLIEGKSNPEALANEIRSRSYAMAGKLPDTLINNITKVTNQLKPGEYKQVYGINRHIKQIADHSDIKNVVRHYLKSEPVLLESTLMVTKPEHKMKPGDQNTFHLDYAGWESLNVFVYLTDVSLESSYHELLIGSHNSIGWRDVLEYPIAPDQMNKNHKGEIAKITGQCGTVFFENTEAFHRRRAGYEGRVMLNLLFASHKSWASNGRASQKHLDWRASIFRNIEAGL